MITTPLRSLCALAAASLACSSPLASAAIVGGDVIDGTSGGVFELLAEPPAEAGPNTFQSPNLIGFDEQQRVVLDAPLVVGPDRILPIGSIVWSHYVVFDPNVGSTVEGYVDFDRPIVGILDTAEALEATADWLGAETTIYSFGNAIGLEQGGFDQLSRTPGNPLRLQFRAGARSPGDHVRVLTGIVPEPATCGLLLLACGGMALVGFRPLG